MLQQRSARSESIVAASISTLIILLLSARALVYSHLMEHAVMVLLLPMLSALVWLLIWWWFLPDAPVSISCAACLFLVSRAILTSQEITRWNDANSYECYSQTWMLVQVLVIVSYVFLAWALYHVADAPILVLAVIAMYATVSLIRLVFISQFSLGEFQTWTFLRNLSGGCTYICLWIYFLFEVLGRREARLQR